jgi:hypothetical protein
VERTLLHSPFRCELQRLVSVDFTSSTDIAKESGENFTREYEIARSKASAKIGNKHAQPPSTTHVPIYTHHVPIYTHHVPIHARNKDTEATHTSSRETRERGRD